MKRLNITPDPNKEVDFLLYKRENADDVTTPFSPKVAIQEFTNFSNPLDRSYGEGKGEGILLEPKTDIWCEAKVTASTGVVAAQFDLELVRV